MTRASVTDERRPEVFDLRPGDIVTCDIAKLALCLTDDSVLYLKPGDVLFVLSTKLFLPSSVNKLQQWITVTFLAPGCMIGHRDMNKHCSIWFKFHQ